jgi:molybdopterin-guanine dinucleotide biosynthesis protein B
MKNTTPTLGFAAASGTGKTTLLSKLNPLLKDAKLRFGLIKHSHLNFEIDKPGKDSHTLRQAGASPVLLVSSHRRAMITEFTTISEPKLQDQIKLFDHSALDLILVEGFKAEAFPKIEIHRPSLKHTLIFPHDPTIIAIASDAEVLMTPDNTHLSNDQIAQRSIPQQLNLNNPDSITTFILSQFLNRA